MALAPVMARWLEQALRGLRYGAIHLVVHDAQVVRIERIERIRLTEPSEASQEPRSQPTATTEDWRDATED